MNTERPPRENLVRALSESPALDAATDGMPTMRGHFAVWDNWTEINSAFEGRFMERFAPTSMTKTLSEGRDRIQVLFQHGRDPQIGDKPLGPIGRLEPDTVGAFYEVPLLDTQYNRELIPGLEANLYGASFRFEVISEEFVARPAKSDHNPLGLPERTVTEARVREFGPVTFPAYQAATAGLRSMTDRFLLGRMLDQPDILNDLIELEKQPALLPEIEVRSAIPYAKTEVTDVSSTYDPDVELQWCGENAMDLRALCAWVDDSMDQNTRGAYRFPHHMVGAYGKPGPASVVGVLLAIEEARASSIPDDEKQRVLEHLNSHLSDYNQPERSESDPSEDTTPTSMEPEPSEATTRAIITPRFHTREEWLQWITRI